MEQTQARVSKTPLAKCMDVFGFMALLVLIGYTALSFSSLPDMVPGHYNSAGRVTRIGSKWEIWILPVIATGLWLLLHVLEKYPHTFNYINLREDNREQQYRNGQLMMNLLKNECILLFAYINYVNIKTAFGRAEDLSSFFMPGFLLIIFGTIAYFIVRMIRL